MFNITFISTYKLACVFAVVLGFSQVIMAMENTSAKELEAQIRGLCQGLSLKPTNKTGQTLVLKLNLLLALSAIIKNQMDDIAAQFDEATEDSLSYCEYDLKWGSEVADKLTTLNCQNMAREKSYSALLEEYREILLLIKNKGNNNSKKLDEFIEIINNLRWTDYYRPIENILFNLILI